MVSLVLGLVLRGGSIDIPAATYSLSEIAERLSTPETRVTVAPPIRERGALIALHARSQEQALAIVCKALDLQALSLGKGRIELNADPKVELRSKEWRIALVRDLTQRWKLRQTHLAEMAQADPTQLQRLSSDFIKDKSRYPEDDFPTIQMFLQSGALPKASVVLASSVVTELDTAILRNGIQRDLTTISLPAGLEAEVQRQMKGYGKLTNPVMLQRIFSRGPGQLSVFSGVFATEADGRWVSLPTPGALLRFGRDLKSPTKRVLFSELVAPSVKNVKGLGDDAKAWLSSSQAETTVELKRPGLDKPISLPAHENALSRLIQDWASESGSEVVMELSPMEESAAFSGKAPSDTKLSVADFLAQDDGFGLTSIDGVLTVVNRLAFLDRASGCPMGSIAHFIRVDAGRVGAVGDLSADGPPLPLVQDVLPLVQRRSSPPRNQWFDFGGYRGLSDAYLEGRSLLLWPALSEEVLHQIRSSRTGTREIALNTFTLDALAPLVESFGGPDFTPVRRDNVRAMLQKARLKVHWIRKGAEDLRVSTDLVGLGDEAMDIGNKISFCYPGK